MIEVAAGDYAQNFEAASAADEGLTIRGELDPGGLPDTTISGDGAGVGAPACANCIVVVGSSPTTNVTLANMAVTQDDADDDVTPIHLDGGSDLNTVDVFVDDEFTFAAVEFCSDPGTDIVDAYHRRDRDRTQGGSTAARRSTSPTARSSPRPGRP